MKMQVEEIKRIIRPILKEAGVTRSSLFGSFARGDAGMESDVDVLVDLSRDASLLDMIDLKLKLEDALKRRVDVVEYAALKPRLKEKIMQEAVSVL